MGLIMTLFKIYFSIINAILSVIFGDRYKLLIKSVINLYVRISKLIACPTNEDNRINDAYHRLDCIEEKIMDIKNQVISLQRKLEDIQSKSSIPPPPPPPPPPMPVASVAPTILKAIAKKDDPKKDEPKDHINSKRQRPSSMELKKRKGQLKTTSVRRSPGGTPLNHWSLKDFELMSPEEDRTVAAVMKRALKRRYLTLNQSPPSPIEGSPLENDFSD